MCCVATKLRLWILLMWPKHATLVSAMVSENVCLLLYGLGSQAWTTETWRCISRCRNSSIFGDGRSRNIWFQEDCGMYNNWRAAHPLMSAQWQELRAQLVSNVLMPSSNAAINNAEVNLERSCQGLPTCGKRCLGGCKLRFWRTICRWKRMAIVHKSYLRAVFRQGTRNIPATLCGSSADLWLHFIAKGVLRWVWCDLQVLVETSMLASISGMVTLLLTLLKLESYLFYLLPFPLVLSTLRSGPAASRKTLMATFFLILGEEL